MNADVQKAVERFDSHFAERASSLSWTAALTSYEWHTIRQALRDQEAEIARLRSLLALAAEDEAGRQQTESDLQFVTEERDAILAMIKGAPVVTMKQLKHGIMPSDYAVPWNWNQEGKRVALVVIE